MIKQFERSLHISGLESIFERREQLQLNSVQFISPSIFILCTYVYMYMRTSYMCVVHSSRLHHVYVKCARIYLVFKRSEIRTILITFNRSNRLCNAFKSLSLNFKSGQLAKNYNIDLT